MACECFKRTTDARKDAPFCYSCRHCGQDIPIKDYFLANETAQSVSKKEKDQC